MERICLKGNMKKEKKKNLFFFKCTALWIEVLFCFFPSRCPNPLLYHFNFPHHQCCVQVETCWKITGQKSLIWLTWEKNVFETFHVFEIWNVLYIYALFCRNWRVTFGPSISFSSRLTNPINIFEWVTKMSLQTKIC